MEQRIFVISDLHLEWSRTRSTPTEQSDSAVFDKRMVKVRPDEVDTLEALDLAKELLQVRGSPRSAQSRRGRLSSGK